MEREPQLSSQVQCSLSYKLYIFLSHILMIWKMRLDFQMTLKNEKYLEIQKMKFTGLKYKAE